MVADLESPAGQEEDGRSHSTVSMRAFLALLALTLSCAGSLCAQTPTLVPGQSDCGFTGSNAKSADPCCLFEDSQYFQEFERGLVGHDVGRSIGGSGQALVHSSIWTQTAGIRTGPRELLCSGCRGFVPESNPNPNPGPTLPGGGPIIPGGCDLTHPPGIRRSSQIHTRSRAFSSERRGRWSRRAPRGGTTRRALGGECEWFRAAAGRWRPTCSRSTGP